ncbi:hypothetical protein BKA69DRAFT_1038556 [Paraphysoderma sedebokerense]|nr:hypothetical protein BKA69DRAFT_1038556 [Paraphysoderma sedebokerense]
MPITNRSLSRLADNLTIPLDNVDSSVGDTLLNSTELCQSYKTCFTCIREASCGWCDSSQNCIPGDIWGPTSDLQCASKWDYMHDMVPHVGCYSREYIRIVSDDASDPFFSSSFESLHSPPQHSLPHSNLSLSTSSRSSKPPLPSRDKSSFSHSHPQFNNTHHTTTYGSIAGTTPFNIRNNRHESKTSIGRWDSSKTIWNGSPSNGHSNWGTTEQGDVYGHSSSSDYDKGKNGVSKYLIGEKWSQKRQELLSRYQKGNEKRKN